MFWVVVALLIHQVVLSSCWMMAPYGNNDFNSRQIYGSNVTLNCNDDRIPATHTFEYWIRPDLSIMTGGMTEEFSTLDGYSSWRVSSDGNELQATLLNDKQFGFYYCVVSSGSQKYVVKKSINYEGPYFGNLWPKYRMNVIIGLSAAGVFVVLCIFLALIFSFCHCSEQPNESPEDDEKAIGNGEMNAAYSKDKGVRQRYNANDYEEVRL